MSKNANKLQSYNCTHQFKQLIDNNQNISIPSNWTLPQFPLGQIVKWRWDLNGKTYDFHGLVIGICYSDNKVFAHSGWHYTIRVMLDEKVTHPQVAQIEDLHESLLYQ